MAPKAEGPHPVIPSCVAVMEEQDEEPNLPWDAWPTCPRCEARRQCICPICQTAGSGFPLADYQAAPAPLIPTTDPIAASLETAPETQILPLLHCPLCDEVFRPHFYERCHACGHDFREGIHLANLPFDGLASRVVFAAMIVLTAVTTLFLYFWWLLRG